MPAPSRYPWGAQPTRRAARALAPQSQRLKSAAGIRKIDPGILKEPAYSSNTYPHWNCSWRESTIDSAKGYQKKSDFTGKATPIVQFSVPSRPRKRGGSTVRTRPMPFTPEHKALPEAPLSKAHTPKICPIAPMEGIGPRKENPRLTLSSPAIPHK